ncbi:MAG: YfiR family protein [Ferruginibacter sp.]
MKAVLDQTAVFNIQKSNPYQAIPGNCNIPIAVSISQGFSPNAQVERSKKSGARLHKVFCLLILFFLVAITRLSAQVNQDYALHANIIYRFTKYIDWPNSKKTGDFIIGIVGDSPLTDELKNFVNNKTVGRQKIVIKKYSAAADVFNCHMLFITDDESNSLKKIVAKTAGTSVLLISESEGCAKKGSCINFIIADEHLKLEINKNNIEARNMNIATELLQLGTIVK